jgi:hypothetical protein
MWQISMLRYRLYKFRLRCRWAIETLYGKEGNPEFDIPSSFFYLKQDELEEFLANGKAVLRDRASFHLNEGESKLLCLRYNGIRILAKATHFDEKLPGGGDVTVEKW